MRISTILFAAAFLSASVAFAQEATTAYELTPEAGSTVTDLQNIVINFTEEKVAFYENNRMPVAVLENTTTGDEWVCNEPDRNTFAETDGTEYTFVFLDEDNEPAVSISVPGEYLLTIRGMYSGEEDDVVDYAPITAEYTVAYPVNYVLNPAPGVVESISSISIDFTDNRNVAYYENNRMPVAVLSCGDVEYICYEPDRNTMAESDGAVYVFNFLDEDENLVSEITTPGTWVLTIRGFYLEGDTEDDNEDLPVITMGYTIEYPETYVLTPADGAVVTEIANVTIEFPETKNIVFYENNRMPVAVLTNGLEGDDEVAYYCYEADRNTMAETEGIEYVLTFVDEEDNAITIIEEGTWYLTIQGLAYEVENEDGTYGPSEDALPVINATFYVNGEYTGIESLVNAAVNGNGTVYNLNGVKVGNSLQGLKGIYIVNGKKVVVK